MHGRKKVFQSETEKRILKEKADTYNALVTKILSKKNCNDGSVETLNLSEKILKNNPDFYILWNYRRSILLNTYKYSSKFEFQKESNDKLNLPELAEQELKLSEDGIRRNPKSYGAWYHRKWIFDRFLVDKDSELELCSRLLTEDQRNFHCWNYRRHVVITSNHEVTDEFKYTTEKINENFSNYSAFHQRSLFIKLLPCIQQVQSYITAKTTITNQHTETILKHDFSIYFDEFKNIIQQEFNIIENAIFTEPDDQSAWWYHQFLLKWLKSLIISNTTRSHQNSELKCESEFDANLLNYDKLFWKTLFTQKIVIQNLLSLENTNKWALVCLVDIYENMLQMNNNQFKYILEYENEIHYDDIKQFQKSIKTLCINILNDLIDIDPSHNLRYKYMMNKFNNTIL